MQREEERKLIRCFERFEQTYEKAEQKFSKVIISLYVKAYSYLLNHSTEMKVNG